MLSQTQPRRLSVGAKSRVCNHCGRSFRRTEHLERHIRTHTKEKPYTCFCGAAFSRRDLLKRHTGITHQDASSNNNNTKNNNTNHALVSPRSQSDLDVPKQPPRSRASNHHVRHYHSPPEPRQETSSAMPLPPSPGVSQWTIQQSPYMGQDQGMLNTNGGGLTVTHDAEILEAAQLLLPGSLPVSYPDPEPSPPTLAYLPEELNHFQEFTHFLDSIGLPLEWVPAGGEIPQVHSAMSTDTTDPGNNINTTNLKEHTGSCRRVSAMERTRADSPFRSWLPSVPPGDQSLGMVTDYEPPQHEKKSLLPLKVTEEQAMHLATSLEEFRHLIPDFVLPSRHTLTRYMTSFFDGFYPHLPFIHIPTFQINERAPELILAILTVGAQYRFERRNAEHLFYAAKAIALYRLSNKPCSPPAAAFNTTTQIPLDTIRELSQPASGQISSPSPLLNPELTAGMSAWRQIEITRTLVILMGYSTWEKSAELVQEALHLQSLIVRSLREFGLTENFTVTPSHSPQQWREWAEEESIRRTLFIAFCYVHIHSIAYNIYPVLRSSEVHLRLPCSTKEWKAATVEDWEAATREVGSQQLFFQDALATLLQPSRSTVMLDPIPAPVGNYILLHGLLQRIHLVSELCISKGSQSLTLPTEELNKLERALRSWTSVWQQTPESSLDPHNENGPIPFTSSSLLGLAYVRLSLNLGPHRQLETRDPYLIASALHRSPKPGRSYRLTPALIYSVHALSIPVRLGIDHIARSQAFFWSVQHSIASLDCAVLLSKWLFSLSEEGGDQGLSENENRILYWTRCIVQEAYDSLDLDEGEDFPVGLNYRSLGFAVIKLWARLFRKNTQWGVINVLGESLERYLEMIP